jgi:hypothetical protein
MYSEVLFEFDLLSFEKEGRLPSQKSFSDSQKLLCNNREHFNINSVELIEASPSTLLGQSTE